MNRIHTWISDLVRILVQGRLSGARPGYPGHAPKRFTLIRKVVVTPSLSIGLILVTVLAASVLIGPWFAPYNPYLRTERVVEHFDEQLGEFIRPPLAPSPDYPLGTDPWGRDTLSLLLYGARNTIIAAGFITVFRVLMGVLVGTAAGWNEGSLFDRLTMTLVGIITSLPMLISSMILIFGLGIERGFGAFMIALTLIGWTEIAQYIRSEMIVIREKGYVEGARSLGMDELAVAIRHALPNITPQTVVLSFLELGAVMMLIGELAFVGLFIGGGSRVAIDRGLGEVEFINVANIPEWGAMLATGFRYLRAAPFVVVPPAMAFFLATIGFNALGEGLRTLFEESGIGTAFILRRETALGIAAAFLGGVFLMNQTGPSPWYARLARDFNGNEALTHVAELSRMGGRAIGQAGSTQAVEYIQAHFREYGLAPAWRNGSYLIEDGAALTEPIDQPQLRLVSQHDDTVFNLRHQIDFGYELTAYAGAGTVSGPLAFVGFPGGNGPLLAEEYKGLDLRDHIAVVIQDRYPSGFVEQAVLRGALGLLVIQPDDLSFPTSPRVFVPEVDASLGQGSTRSIPVFSLRPGALHRALSSAGMSLTDLSPSQSQVNAASWYRLDPPLDGELSLSLSERRPMTIQSVVGFLPGSDADLAHQLIVLVAHYDGLGKDPDGTVFPGANSGASGIAVMLELARSWHDQQFVPGRSVLFVAWGAGASPEVRVRSYLDNPDNFLFLQTAAITESPLPFNVFYLDRLGSGSTTLEAQPVASGGGGLALTMIAAADQDGVPLIVVEPASSNGAPKIGSRNTPGLILSRSRSTIRPDRDTLDRIEPGLLEQAGRLLSLGVTRIAFSTSE